MKLTEYKPGIAIKVMLGRVTFARGIALSKMCIPYFVDKSGKKRYYISVKIMQDNGTEGYWPLRHIYKIRSGGIQ